MLEKTLFKTKEEFDSFIDENTGYDPGYGIVKVCDWADREPKNYPCIAVWKIQFDGFDPCYLESKFVYLDDFEAK